MIAKVIQVQSAKWYPDKVRRLVLHLDVDFGCATIQLPALDALADVQLDDEVEIVFVPHKEPCPPK